MQVHVQYDEVSFKGVSDGDIIFLKTDSDFFEPLVIKNANFPGIGVTLIIQKKMITRSENFNVLRTFNAWNKGLIEKGPINYQGAMVYCEDCHGLKVRGGQTFGGLYGVEAIDCTKISWIRTATTATGQQGIITRHDIDRNAEHTLVNIDIIQTGLKKKQYGEGIKIGDDELRKGRIKARILQPTISSTTNEAIDIKAQCDDFVVTGSMLEDINLQFNGAITYATAASSHYSIGKGELTENTIKNVQSNYMPNYFAIGDGKVTMNKNILINETGVKARALGVFSTFSSASDTCIKGKDNILIGEFLEHEITDGGTKLDVVCKDLNVHWIKR